VANRFRSPEADVNALGYRLLNAQRVREAIAVFRLNTREFPRSANVWDSLGEALIVAGQREAGVAAYRRALEIDPQFRSSQDALRRLGLEPQ
jgi:cytochrome c-type biogenesis protein CcmH/NrfG